MRILVTGAAGFIGSNLVDALLKDPRIEMVRAVDRRSMHFFERSERMRILQGDFGDARFMRKALAGIDLVYHLAAVSSVLAAQNDPHACQRDGEGLVLHLLEAARKTKHQRIVFASSCAVYGSATQSLLHEDLTPQPCSVYGASKLACEGYFKAYAHSQGLNCVVLRLFNVYGPPVHHSVAPNSVVNLFCRQALGSAAVTIRGDGEQTRDYLFVDDAIAALKLAGIRPGPWLPEPVNIGTGVGTSIRQVVSEIARKLSVDLDCRNLPAHASEALNARADTGRAAEIMEFRSQVSFTEGVARTVDWYRSHVSALSVLEATKVGYGIAPFGAAVFGGSRKVSDGKIQVVRNISRTGQLSYRGQLYSLGAQYRGGRALILEQRDRLIVSVDGGAPIALMQRR